MLVIISRGCYDFTSLNFCFKKEKKMLKRLLLAALVVASCSAETSTIQLEPQLRRLDPTYIFGAVSGAVNAVAARKQEKHPEKIHPLSVLAALFNQASQVVHDDVAEEEAQKRTIDFVQKPCSEMDIQGLIDTLTEQAASDEIFKHIVSNTRYFNVYLLTEADQRAEYLAKILSSDTNKKAFVGELLGSAGNYVADKVYRTANDLAVTMLDAISRADISTKRTIQTAETVKCNEAALLEAIKRLVTSGQRNLENDDISWSVIDSLVTVGLTLRAILLSDVNLFSFWKETAFVGALIATDDAELIREKISSFVSDDEQRVAFVQELVYCIYHVVFNRLGQMLALAYQTVQLTAATEQMTEDAYAQETALQELDEELAAMQDAMALEALDEAIAEMEQACDDTGCDYSDYDATELDIA